jgi:hypothetical protein
MELRPGQQLQHFLQKFSVHVVVVDALEAVQPDVVVLIIAHMDRQESLRDAVLIPDALFDGVKELISVWAHIDHAELPAEHTHRD